LIVYHPHFLFGSRTLNWFHPFEFNRAQLAAGRLRESLGSKLEGRLLEPSQAVTLEELSLVHSPEYLESIKSSKLAITRVIEVPLLAVFPRSWVESWFLVPALWSMAGSLLAARTALEEGVCLSLGGGFHHASRGGGEGFCLFSDIAFAIETLRADGTLGPNDRIAYLDLDVHQGNGVSLDYQEDLNVKILDAYNSDTYPVFGESARGRVDVDIPLQPQTGDDEYLLAVEQGLEKFETLVAGTKLLIYNAGTDIYREDKLGGLLVSHQGVNRRDATVTRFARKLGLPMVALASGGYSRTSAALLSEFAVFLLEGS